jgi:hypothetical protein
MTIVGFGFTKISIERKGNVVGKVSINNNVSITKVSKTDLSFGKMKQDALKFEFEFSALYEPKMGSILISGELIWMDKKENVENMDKEWKKSKTVDKEVMTPVLNQVLNKCNIEALLLSRELNLPAPIPLPKVTPKQSK